MHAPDYRQISALLNGVDDAMSVLAIISDMAGGKPCWAYARLRLHRYMELLEIQKTGKPYRLTDYAYEILAFGEGETPPEQTRQDMEKKFGADAQFEERVLRLLDQASLAIKNASSSA